MRVGQLVASFALAASLALPLESRGFEVPPALGLSGKGTEVVVFLSARCPCSKSHEEGLARLAKEFAASGVKFRGVHSNADEPAEEARAHFAQAALGFEVLEDSGSQVADAMGALKTPHAYVMKDGKLVFHGGVDDSATASRAQRFFLRDVLAALRDGQAPPFDKARSLGCVIKRP